MWWWWCMCIAQWLPSGILHAVPISSVMLLLELRLPVAPIRRWRHGCCDGDDDDDAILKPVRSPALFLCPSLSLSPILLTAMLPVDLLSRGDPRLTITVIFLLSPTPKRASYILAGTDL